MKHIVSYDPYWATLYTDEASVLASVLGKAASAFHHMGSTAIPGMPAKPIIDILVEVPSLAGIDACTADLADLGYDARGEYGIAGRRYFSRKPSGPSIGCHLHAYLAGSDQIRRHLAFRDYLLAKPEIASQYAALKRHLSFPDGRLKAEYQAGKKPFVDALALDGLAYFDNLSARR